MSQQQHSYIINEQNQLIALAPARMRSGQIVRASTQSTFDAILQQTILVNSRMYRVSNAKKYAKLASTATLYAKLVNNFSEITDDYVDLCLY